MAEHGKCARANVLDSMAHAPDPRLKQVMSSLVFHLLTFIREFELTQEEWALGIQFLTGTGLTCNEKPQEFILQLSGYRAFL